MTETAPLPLLQVRGLKKHFPVIRGFFNRVVGHVLAVNDVSFDLREGECLSLVGESGSGKTTTARTILRAMAPTAGQVLFRTNGKTVDLATLSAGEIKPLRLHMQMIFQDPFSSLNPRMTVQDIIGEPLLLHGMRSRRQRRQRVTELLGQVGLRPQHLRRYPHAFSGGQRQRIGIARALALQPRLIVADEPVSALDVSVQAQVINLLQRLQREYHLTYLFIAHDLSVVRHISDHVAVMYAGQIAELADVAPLFARPLHPYTEALLSAAPVAEPHRASKRILLTGDVADPANLPGGCIFHPRCRYAQDRCKSEAPVLRDIEPGRQARCHFAEELTLQPML